MERETLGRRRLPIILVCLVLFGLFLSSDLVEANVKDSDLVKAMGSIRPESLYDVCRTLAHPKYAGRLTGHEGYTAAARWGAGRFRAYRLMPISKEQGYLQPYPSPYTIVENAEMKILPRQGAPDSPQELKPGSLELGKDFLPCLFSDSGRQTAEVVFVGWGISAPGLSYDDYSGVDVRGRFVLCLRGVPDGADSRYEDYNNLFQRVENAVARGAKGLLIVAPEPLANPSSLWKAGFLHAVVSERTADALLDGTGTTCSKAREALVTYKRPLSFVLRRCVQLAVASRHFPQGVGYNVIGYREGLDPSLKNECVLIGAHLDACGRHLGMLFAGADDNASGSALVIEVAGAFSRLNKKLRRPVAFVLFGGEEMRIMGSEYLAGHLPAPFVRVDGMLNIDMVGQGDRIQCLYGPEASELGGIIRDADSLVKILGSSEPLMGKSMVSDHLPFFLKGVKSAFFFSNGPRVSYHQPGDTIYRINPDILADCARLVFLAAVRLADR